MIKRGTLLIAIAAMVLGVLLNGTALAASYVVSDGDLQGWIITPYNPASSYYAFEDAPDGEPALLMGSGPGIGTGSGNGGKIYLSRSNYDGMSLSTITTLKYSTYMTATGTSNLAIYANIFLDENGDGTFSMWTDDAVLSFSPGDCPTATTVTAGTWQTWDLMTMQAWSISGTRIGSLPLLGESGHCLTFASILAQVDANNQIITANASVGEYGLDFVVGEKTGGTSWANVEGYIDNIIINGNSYAFGEPHATDEDNTEDGASAEDSTTAAANHARAQAPLCADQGGSTNQIVRADIMGGTVSGGGVYCRVLEENGHYTLTPSQIGNMDVINMGPLQAVDVFGMAGGASVMEWNSSVEVCLLGMGRMMFLDAMTSPRALSELPVWGSGGYTCARIMHAGTVVLVP